MYDEAQRSWLERRGAVITRADPEWTRILLASVLEEMVAQEAGMERRAAGESAVWGDEPLRPAGKMRMVTLIASALTFAPCAGAAV